MKGIKNVILITIDALRADHLGCMGYKEDTTPFIDELASNGLFFTQAFANAPGTPSSFSSLLSSTYPLMYGGYERFSKSRPAIQSFLMEKGIRTAAIHSNPYLGRYYGYNRGFSYFYDSFGEKKNLGNSVKEKLVEKIGVLLSKNNYLYKIGRFAYAKLFGNTKPYVDAEETTKKALNWISRNKNSRFFLWIHYMDAHEPYNPPMEFLEHEIASEEIERLNKYLLEDRSDITDEELNTLIELYDGEVRYVDHWIQNLVEEIEEYGILDETAIIITADHGEEFLDHGELGHHPKLYDELLHVPLIIYSSQIENKVINTPVELLDLAPTIAGLYGLENKNFLGDNLLKKKRNKPIISEVSNPHGILKVDKRFKKVSCRKDEWKLIFKESEGKIELYNLMKDPKEKNNLAQEETEKLKDLFKEVVIHEKRKEILNLKNVKTYV